MVNYPFGFTPAFPDPFHHPTIARKCGMNHTVRIVAVRKPELSLNGLQLTEGLAWIALALIVGADSIPKLISISIERHQVVAL